MNAASVSPVSVDSKKQYSASMTIPRFLKKILGIVQRDRLLNPENQTTKSPRHKEVKGRFS
jgi:hypothetical protein